LFKFLGTRPKLLINKFYFLEVGRKISNIFLIVSCLSEICFIINAPFFIKIKSNYLEENQANKNNYICIKILIRMKVLGIIPARYRSVRLEGKPLVDLCGKSMIQRVYEQASKALDYVLIATDDVRIEEAVKKFGGAVVMTSPNHTTGTNRCLEAYEIYKRQSDIQFDVVLNIQGDEPLLAPKQIKSLVFCFESSDTKMATLVIPTLKNEDLNSGVFVVFDKNYDALYFSRSVIPAVRDKDKSIWSKNNTFYKHVGMYGFTPIALKEFANLTQTNLENHEKLEQLRWLENGNRIKVAITRDISVSVDTQEDVDKVRKLLS